MKTIKRVTAKLFIPEMPPIVRTFRAPVGAHFTPAAVEQVAEHLIEDLDNNYPEHEFRMVRIGRDQLNFVCQGKRETAPADPVK